jgi:F-type H+-transporting ATPase subunit b
MLKFDLNILWVFINLILFFVLMKVFLFKPIKKTLDKRKELIDKQFSDAKEAQQQADELKTQYEAELKGVDGEKKQILNEARSNAKKEYNKIVDRAQSDADKIKANAKNAAELEIQKAKRTAKEEIAQLAMETAGKIVENNASAQLDSNLYDEFLNEGSDE